MLRENINNYLDDIASLLMLIFPEKTMTLTISKIGIKSFNELINNINEREFFYVISKIKKNYENNLKFSDLKEDEKFISNRNKLNKKFGDDIYSFVKKIYNNVKNISDREKTEYLINLYNNLVCGYIDYEVFTIASSFLEKANIYEINMAMRLYKGLHVDNSKEYFYIKQLIYFGLVNMGYMSIGDNLDNNEQVKLNKKGNEIIKAFLAR